MHVSARYQTVSIATCHRVRQFYDIHGLHLSVITSMSRDSIKKTTCRRLWIFGFVSDCFITWKEKVMCLLYWILSRAHYQAERRGKGKTSVHAGYQTTVIHYRHRLVYTPSTECLIRLHNILPRVCGMLRKLSCFSLISLRSSCNLIQWILFAKYYCLKVDGRICWLQLFQDSICPSFVQRLLVLGSYRRCTFCI